jgi:endoglucanase
MDEIGMMVSHINEKGLIHMIAVGGIDSRVLPAQEVIIHGKEKVFGVIGMKPPHITSPDERTKALAMSDLTIDTGYSPEKINELVNVGDIITFDAKATELKSDQITGKSMDDAVGVAVLLSTVKRLRDINHDLDVYFVATTQEEIGAGGAMTSAYNIKPDMAIAIDVGFAKTPELQDSDTIEMGKGPAIGIGTAIHPGIFEILKQAAKDFGIKYQIDVLPARTGTDTDSIQIANEGVATGVLSVPLKYMHTPIETVLVDDIEQTGRLLAGFIQSFNDKDLEEALCL